MADLAFVTGSTGFIGSHLVERLLRRQPVRTLVRDVSRARKTLPPETTVIQGTLEDEATLREALDGVTTVYHLAGLTRARSLAEFEAVNAEGAGRLARIAEEVGGIRRFLLMSSLAAAGPARDGRPVDEGSTPTPVCDYGRSKLAGERRVVEALERTPWTIVRPPAVYGPREQDLLQVVRMVARRFAPILGMKPKSLSVVFAEDLVEATIALAELPAAAGETLFVAEDAVYEDREFVGAIEAAVGRRALKPRLPHLLGWIAGLLGTAVTPLMRRPPLMTLHRMTQLAPEAWTCSATRTASLGVRCPTPLEAGMRATVAWYREAGWLR